MGKEMMRTEYRNEIVERIRQFLETDCDTYCRYVAGGELTLPAIDNNGEEYYLNIKVTVPRGKREGGTYKPYDGDAAADAYRDDIAIKKEEKSAKEAAKAHAEKEKVRKREAKKVVKALNTEGFKALVQKVESEESA